MKKISIQIPDNDIAEYSADFNLSSGRHFPYFTVIKVKFLISFHKRPKN